MMLRIHNDSGGGVFQSPARQLLPLAERRLLARAHPVHTGQSRAPIIGAHETRTFKSGNSVALRLPKGLGMSPDERFAISRDGDTVAARRIPTLEEEAERLRRLRAGVDALAALPRVSRSPGTLMAPVLLDKSVAIPLRDEDLAARARAMALATRNPQGRP